MVLTEKKITELAKNMFISLLLLLLLILSHIGDTILLSLIKISCFAAAVVSFCFIGNQNLFDVNFSVLQVLEIRKITSARKVSPIFAEQRKKVIH